MIKFQWGGNSLNIFGCANVIYGDGQYFFLSMTYPRVMGFRSIIDFPIWRLTVLTLNSYDDWNYQRMAS